MIPQATVAGEIVGLVLQNPTSATATAREITFGQEFTAGQVPAGTQLVAMIGGRAVAVQMDVKTTNPDGSVAMAVLTMEQPAIAAGVSTPVMLALAPTGTGPGTPVNIAALAAPGSSYNLVVNLRLHNSDGSTTPVTINAGQALAAALKSGAYSTWLSGPQATQVRIDVPVAGSLHVTMDITDYADGTTSTDVSFNNDIAMTATGGTAVYDATITQNGAVAFQQNAITQYQYTEWDQTFASNGAPGVNVQHDIAALEKTGLIQNYDLTTGVATSQIAAAETTQLNSVGFDSVLSNAGIYEGMPDTGGRWDIGTTTEANALWLMTQNATAAEYALDQANAAGSIPWHMSDPTTGTFLTATAYPTLWADSRGGTSVGYRTTGLTQPLPTPAQTGWHLDVAHQPDNDYIAYLMTGDQYYLDQLNAQASYDVLSMRPNTNTTGVLNGRQGAAGIVADGNTQVRAAAWNLREIVEAAAANPDGSPEKAYFTQVENNNFNYLLTFVSTLNEGQATGWMPGAYPAGFIAPWQQDYLATTVALAAEQGNAAAKQLLGWETNFLAGRFVNAANGFSPYLGGQYNLAVDSPTGGQIGSALQTWSAIATQTLATGSDGATATTQIKDLDYAQGARAALAGDITVTEDVRAIQAFGWINAYTGANSIAQSSADFNIAPRLSDGNLLTANNIIITSDSIAKVIGGSATADQLIYEIGNGNVTLRGGAGMNILFAGSGADTLVGGSNNDYLFAGSGADTLSGGAGVNYMQAGTGADTFVLSASQAATDTIADFKVGIDHLHVLGTTGSALTASAITSLLGAVTSDGAGGSVLHLAAGHNVALAGIGASKLSSAMFN